MFQYFTKLLEQYTKVLIPPKDVMKKLEEESKNEKVIREHVSQNVHVTILNSNLHNVKHNYVDIFYPSILIVRLVEISI